jgi:hypothetical protein
LNAPAFTAVVRYTRSPHAIGDDQPRPGISALHATFSAFDQRRGRLDESATPEPSAPRNWGQLTVLPGSALAAHRHKHARTGDGRIIASFLSFRILDGRERDRS